MKAILMSGIAGSGKSTWAKKYADEHINTVIISTDDIRYELFKSYELDKTQEKMVQKTIMERVANCARQGLDIIVDIAIVKNNSRLKWYNKLRAYYKRIELVYLNIPLDVCLENNQKRDRHVPEYVIKFMNSIKEDFIDDIYDKFDKITTIEHYDNV